MVIPARERKRAGLQPQDKVEGEGDTIVIRPIDARRLGGLGKERGRTAEPVDYVPELR